MIADTPKDSVGPREVDASCYSTPDGNRIEQFVSLVLSEGENHYRELPWRFVDDPYVVLVSEVMLQQTQVARVLGKWGHWCSKFPSVDALAAADNAEVLEEWQGLGYNRRALALKRTCEICAKEHGGELPEGVDALCALPGIGPATAAGVTVFARNEAAIYLETNVRTVLICEFFPEGEAVHDRALRPILQECLLRIPCDMRTWYYALLDFGAHLKSSIPNPSRRSAHYARQSAFEGSHRQKRSELLRFVLAQSGCTLDEAVEHLTEFEYTHRRPAPDSRYVADILSELASEGFFREEGGRWVS